MASTTARQYTHYGVVIQTAPQGAWHCTIAYASQSVLIPVARESRMLHEGDGNKRRKCVKYISAIFSSTTSNSCTTVCKPNDSQSQPLQPEERLPSLEICEVVLVTATARLDDAVLQDPPRDSGNHIYKEGNLTG